MENTEKRQIVFLTDHIIYRFWRENENWLSRM